MKQVSLEQIWGFDNHSSSDDDRSQALNFRQSQTDGIQLWTRVISLHGIDLLDFPLFDLTKDLNLDKVFKDVRLNLDSSSSSILFDPKQVFASREDAQQRYRKIEADILFDYGKKASLIRNNFMIQSLKQYTHICSNQCRTDGDCKGLTIRSQRKYCLKTLKPKFNQNISGFETRQRITKKRYFTASQLSWALKEQIVQNALGQNRTYQEIANTFQVKRALVQSLVCKFRADENFFKKKINEDFKNDQISQFMTEQITKKNEQGQAIWKSQDLVDAFKQDHSVVVKKQQVIQVMKEHLGMKFRRVKRIPFRGNIERNIHLRKEYGSVMLNILASGKRVINIDETWISQTDFRNSKWMAKGTKNSHPIKSMAQRINMIAAIDNRGQIYYSLSQYNTDSTMFSIFLSRLTQQLSKEEKDWRSQTIFLLDGASYHQSELSRNYFKQLSIQVVISAPYSYDAAPCEFLFAYLKKTELNPLNLRTSKRYFREVVRLVDGRLKTLSKGTAIMFWHHTTLALFRYLTLERL